MAHVFLLVDQYDVQHKPAKVPEDEYYADPVCIMQNYDSIDRVQNNFYEDIINGKKLAFCNSCASIILNRWRDIESSDDWHDSLYESFWE